MKVICIGSASKDIFFPTSEGIVLDTPEDVMAQKKIAFELGAKYQIENRYEAPGGVAANVAQGLGRLGIKVACYSKVGGDILGTWIKEELIKENVDVSFMQIAKESVSDLSAIIVDSRSGDRTIFFNRDANEKLEIVENDLKQFDWLFVSALNGNAVHSWADHMEEILEIARKYKINIALNPGQKNIQDNPALIMKAIENSRIIFLNKDEAIGILNNPDSKVKHSELLNDENFLLKELKNLGPAVVALTDGKRGAWSYDGEKILFAIATVDRPVETTGAGDAFTAGFLAAYLESKDLAECLQYGVANGGNVVKYHGAKEGLLRKSEILEKVKNIKINTRN